MKKVLMVSYIFPPFNGPGKDRTLSFARTLRHFGWEPVILTREVRIPRDRNEPHEENIPESTDIYRTHPWELTELPGLLGLAGRFLSRKLLIPDKERLWELFSQRKASRIVKSEGIDLIYTYSPPASSHLIGLYMKRKFPGIPWVADFRDEWTGSPISADGASKSMRSGIEGKMKKQILEKADYLIAGTHEILQGFLQDNRSLSLKERFFVVADGVTEDLSGIFEKSCRILAAKKITQ